MCSGADAFSCQSVGAASIMSNADAASAAFREPLACGEDVQCPDCLALGCLLRRRSEGALTLSRIPLSYTAPNRPGE